MLLLSLALQPCHASSAAPSISAALVPIITQHGLAADENSEKAAQVSQRSAIRTSPTRSTQSIASAATTVLHFSTLPPHASLPSDAHCAAIIPSTPETIPGNAPFNRTAVSRAQLRAFAAEGYTFETLSSYAQYARITGDYIGSTDMIMRWAACKYGVDEDVVRGQAWQESYWRQWQTGDRRSTRPECVQSSFTALWDSEIALTNGSVVSCRSCCWTSWSAWQTKVYYEWKTWPMIRDSTSFAAEYRFADTRACMDGAFRPYFAGRSAYNGHNTYDTDLRTYDNDPTPAHLDTVFWGCIGSHASGGWYDPTAVDYIADIKADIVHRRWLTPNIHITGR
jgi:autotransporter family porin